MKFQSVLRISFSLFLLFVLGTSLRAQGVSIHARLDRSEILTGGQAIIDVVIRTDDLANTHFYQEERPGEEARFRVLEFVPVDTVRVDDRIMEIQARMLITSFDSTFITIPPIIVETPSGKSQSEALGLRVIQPDVDVSNPDKYYGEKDLWDVNLSLWEWIKLIMFSKWAMIVYALLLIAFVAYRLYKRYKASPSAPIAVERPTVYVPTDYEQAMSALDELRSSNLLDEELYKEYYTRLVEIVKVYIDARKGWGVQEQTTFQLQETFARGGIGSDVAFQIEQILEDADLSKFARNKPSRADAQRSLELASSVVTILEELWSPSPEGVERRGGA